MGRKFQPCVTTSDAAGSPTFGPKLGEISRHFRDRGRCRGADLSQMAILPSPQVDSRFSNTGQFHLS